MQDAGAYLAKGSLMFTRVSCRMWSKLLVSRYFKLLIPKNDLLQKVQPQDSFKVVPCLSIVVFPFSENEAKFK